MSYKIIETVTLERVANHEYDEQGICESCMFFEAALQTDEVPFCNGCKQEGYWRFRHELT